MKILISLIILGSFLLTPLHGCFAQEQTISVPSNLEEIKELSRSVLRTIPYALKTAGREGLAVMKWILGPIKSFAATHIEPSVFRAINWLKSFLGKEVEQKKPEVKEEFRKETEHIREKLPTGKSLWEKFKSLFR